MGILYDSYLKEGEDFHGNLEEIISELARENLLLIKAGYENYLGYHLATITGYNPEPKIATIEGL